MIIEPQLSEAALRGLTQDLGITLRKLDPLGGSQGVESYIAMMQFNAAQIAAAAEVVSSAGCPVLRGGAFKPRTSPYSFQGLGAQGVRLLLDAAGEQGLGVVVISHNLADVFEVVDRIIVLRLGRRVATFDVVRRRAAPVPRS